MLITIYGIVIWLDSSSLTAGTAGTAEPSRRGATLAVHSMLGYAGGFVGPLLVGWVLDLSGGMSQVGWGMSFLSVAVLMVLALITFWLIRPRELEGDQARERIGAAPMQEQHDAIKRPSHRWRTDPMVIAVNALGITQITAWGTSYYCLGVLAKPIVAETGWGMSTVFLGFSVALLVMGFISTWVGRLIDRVGARAVMSIGTIIVSAGLFALSQVHDQASYFAVWAVLGVGMRCCLYDAAFAALVQVTPTRGRKAISYLTLYGAYASTVFWVIGHYLNEAYGWRGTLIIFAAINLAICLPLNWIGLSRRDAPDDTGGHHTAARASPDGPVLEGRMRVIGIDPVRAHHVAQRLRVRRHLAADGAAARSGGARRGNGSLGCLPEGARPVCRPARRDLLRTQSQGDDHRPHRHRRRAGLAAPALSRARRPLVAGRLHPGAGCLAGRHHHRARRRAAGPVWRQGLWRGAGADRDARSCSSTPSRQPSSRCWSTGSAGRSRSTRCWAARW